MLPSAKKWSGDFTGAWWTVELIELSGHLSQAVPGCDTMDRIKADRNLGCGRTARKMAGTDRSAA
jgi:hypothetical protein